jgi:preprotein translocase subunit YajC
MQNLSLIAQAETIESQPAGNPEQPAEPMGQSGQPVVSVDSNAPGAVPPMRSIPQYYNLVFIAVIVVVMFLMFREPRRKQKQHQKMVQTLKKNDKIRTIGGIIGTVVDIKEDEIVLKIDESNNTKIRVVPSAIGKNLSEGQ